ncbi:hypothetical protein GCM10010911_59230 [Paenibacillus nasutitermitis]|uniref:Uncharacterized protein n=1 Tax=Paenibacillus nasutitermitis TaxID=1652958 RepID=A0A916ZEM3_9BACL|nr:hypothetical protein GCM10010911_59230 [Paenibacillus nasutitermitis]
MKDRILRNQPSLRDQQWKWLWFELKRYFLMCAIMRGVPMYSDKVDDVWHEMLMFTREYEQFCTQLSGGLIHHAPHGDGSSPEQGERAWFDWIYGELFVMAPASGQLWGSFYHTPLSQERMETLERLSADELRRSYFNVKALEKYPDLQEAADYIIGRGKELAYKARSGIESGYTTGRSHQWSDPLFMTGAFSGALFLSSMLPADQFENGMEEAYKKERGDAYSSSGCGSYSDRDDNDGGHDGSPDNSSCGGSGGDSGSGDGGGGSSCSSSCGSSCGGGGGD